MAFNLFRIPGLCGTVLIGLAILISAVSYRGKRGETFSLLNYFISELGEVGVSRLARVFNYSMIIGGLLLVPYIIGLGISFHSLV